MVADKLKLDKISSDSIGCRIRDKINHNLDDSYSLSSDESLKIKSDHENHTDQSLDSSAKDESDDESKELNCTYSCSDPNAFDEEVSDSKINKDTDSIELVNFKDEDKSRTWNYKELLNFTSDFDTAKWESDLEYLKIGNITLENSKMANDNPNNSVLIKMRNCIAEYQEMRGTPRDDYTYSTLIKTIGHATGRCLFALSYVILNLAPILEIFLHILRFILEKSIDITNTTDISQIVVKSVIFLLQLLSIYICLVFIFGFIVLPIIRMAIGILAKIMLYD